MSKFGTITDSNKNVKVHHDLMRQVLEILSLIRVMNNYYYKKKEIQEKIRPTISSFIYELKGLEKNKDWLFSIPSVLSTINQEFVNKNDSFRFPDGIILFEAWMNLGLESLYPQIVFCFKVPGFLKGEKSRYIFQFVFSISRGIGFPIYFSPEYYNYTPKFLKYLNPLFKWIYKISHFNNILIKGAIENRLNTKRHHPGEFESVIISEFENNIYKGINTLFHGYFTNEPKLLGKFNSLNEVLEKIIFSYRIGDHAMCVLNASDKDMPYLNIPLVDYKLIKQRYEVDFYSYIEKLMNVNNLLSKKSDYYYRKGKYLILNLPLVEKFKFLFYIIKKIFLPTQKIPDKFENIENYHKHKHLLEHLRNLLWTTPLYCHTIHDPSRIKEIFKFSQKPEELDEFEYEITSRESIFFSFIKSFEKEKQFRFENEEVINALGDLRDSMAKMWLYFRERHFNSAIRKLNTLVNLSVDNKNYKSIIKQTIKQLIPIMAVYEIFIRPLSNSFFPESIPQTKRLGAYLAKFFTSKYNPLGLSLINFFNKLAYRNWANLVLNKKLNRREFFNLIVKLPIWKHIPNYIRDFVLD